VRPGWGRSVPAADLTGTLDPGLFSLGVLLHRSGIDPVIAWHRCPDHMSVFVRVRPPAPDVPSARRNRREIEAAAQRCGISTDQCRIPRRL
jgi:hypothetical protein